MTWWVALLFLQLPQRLDLPDFDKNPHTTPADIAQGRKLYQGRCAGCHGPGGDGGKGANLCVAQLPRAADDRALYRVIRYGIPETEMPGTLMAPREVWQVAAFVRSLGNVAGEPVRGNAARGREVVHGKGGCLQCHSVGTEGGQFGPPLEGIGTRRSPAHLRAKLTDPAGDLPEQFRMVEASTRDGRRLAGIRLNEDTWSIQLRDPAGKLYSLWKQDLADLKVERRTVMPSYGRSLASDELENVVAYLAGLRGER
jgi:putative heme-binding domain-containing protein